MPAAKAVLALMMAIPLSSDKGWETLAYSSIPANTVSYSKSGMKVSVKKSAAPIIYAFDKAMTISQAEARGKLLSGKIKISNASKQGQKKLDDFVFRLGLVVEGTQTLSWIKRRIAPAWVKKMFSLAPKGSGVDHILFLEVAQDAKLVGTKRNHHLSKYLKENIVSSIQPNGEFVINHHFDKPVKALGVWISIDGDDTGSDFEVELSKLAFQTKK